MFAPQADVETTVEPDTLTEAETDDTEVETGVEIEIDTEIGTEGEVGTETGSGVIIDVIADAGLPSYLDGFNVGYYGPGDPNIAAAAAAADGRETIDVVIPDAAMYHRTVDMAAGTAGLAAVATATTTTTTNTTTDPTEAKLQTVVPFPQCIPHQDVTRLLTVTFLVDYGYYLATGASPLIVLSRVAVLLAWANTITVPQLSLHLAAARVLLMTSPSTNKSTPWNYDSPSDDPDAAGCPALVSGILPALTRYRASAPDDAAALVHQLTACPVTLPASAATASPYASSLCNNQVGVSASSFAGDSALPFLAHVGVALGATPRDAHGGVMAVETDVNYGTLPSNDTLNPQRVAFSAAGARTPMCNHLTNVINHVAPAHASERVSGAACLPALTPACGNGVLDDGEQCDPGSVVLTAAGHPCCDKYCQLRTGAECSDDMPCCSTACRLLTTRDSCDRGLGVSGVGYCGVQGECSPSVCDRYGLTPCGPDEASPCTERCLFGSTCTSDPAVLMISDALNALHKPVGAVCAAGTTSGRCIATETSSTTGQFSMACETTPAVGWLAGEYGPCLPPTAGSVLSSVDAVPVASAAASVLASTGIRARTTSAKPDQKGPVKVMPERADGTETADIIEITDPTVEDPILVVTTYTETIDVDNTTLILDEDPIVWDLRGVTIGEVTATVLAPCDTTVRTRTVTCFRLSDNKTIDSSLCAHLVAPASVVPCANYDCYNRVWHVGYV